MQIEEAHFGAIHSARHVTQDSHFLAEITKQKLQLMMEMRLPRGNRGRDLLLKRAFGRDRCTWRGDLSFRSYIWSGVLAANLLTLARHQLA